MQPPAGFRLSALAVSRPLCLGARRRALLAHEHVVPVRRRLRPCDPCGAKFALKPARSGDIRGLTSIRCSTETDQRRPRPRRRGRRRHRRRPAPLAAQRGLRGPHLGRRGRGARRRRRLRPRPGRARPRPARPRRGRGLPPPAQRRRRADPDADRAGRDRGPGRPASTAAPTTTWSSRSSARSCWRGSGPCCAAGRRAAPPRWRSATCSSTPTPARCAAASARSS